jgi:hypothetical protein
MLQYSEYWQLQDICNSNKPITARTLRKLIYIKARKITLLASNNPTIKVTQTKLETGGEIWEARVF